jgi:hypothetical protein
MARLSERKPRGWVPTLIQSLYHPTAAVLPRGANFSRFTPLHFCSESRGEDVVVLDTFFTDIIGNPLRNGLFLEMGAVDGVTQSNSFYFEACLGWRGILIEASPSSFAELLNSERQTLNVRLAVCAEHGWVNLTTSKGAKTTNRIVDPTLPGEVAMEQVQCGPLADHLSILGVERIDLFVLDVEGSEVTAVRTLYLGSNSISIGVLIVEVREDGKRSQLLNELLQHGMAYVGQIHARPSSEPLEIIDDVYVNMSHLQRFMPTSRALVGV